MTNTTTYYVKYRPEGETEWSYLPIPVGGGDLVSIPLLEPGVNYQVALVAVNINGQVEEGATQMIKVAPRTSMFNITSDEILCNIPTNINMLL